MTVKLNLHSLMEGSARLPSLPSVAVEILALARRQDVTIKEIGAVIEKDPALAAKVLRIANSPVYARINKIENLRRAVVMLGFNAAVNIALSFSLTASIQRQHGQRLDYIRFWRRSVLAAAAAAQLGKAAGEEAIEELFLAGLLQDIGMLAIDKVAPGFYAELDEGRSGHDDIIAYERERAGQDHAEVGAHLMKQWHLAERTVMAIEASHKPQAIPAQGKLGRFGRCVALSGEVAELLMLGSGDGRYLGVLKAAAQLLGLQKVQVERVLIALDERLPELEALFDVELMTGDYPSDIFEQANEILISRNLASLQGGIAAPEPSQAPDVREGEAQAPAGVQAAAEESPHDAVTGTFSRAFFESYLTELFMRAHRNDQSLSLILLAVTNLREISLRHGGGAADFLLIDVARALEETVRAGDVIARYGDEVFVVVLPGAEREEANLVRERIERHCAGVRRAVSGGQVVGVELITQVVTHGGGTRFRDSNGLIEAAASALYNARLKSSASRQPRAQKTGLFRVLGSRD